MMHVYDLVIVGGGPAGLTTSIYAARENLETLVIDSKGLGGQAGVLQVEADPLSRARRELVFDGGQQGPFEDGRGGRLGSMREDLLVVVP